MTDALRARDVTFRYHENGRRNVLEGAELSLAPATLTVLMGAGGCGKSTLAAVLCGLLPASGGFLERGSVTVFGEDVQSLSPDRRAPLISMLFQNPDLQFCMETLRAEMIFCLENRRVPREEMDGQVRETAERLGLTGLLDRPLVTLSGGEKQKAALGCLFLLGSRVIVLDEPFANLDPAQAAGLVETVGRLRDEGRTILVIDHLPTPWLKAADEFIVLGEGGRIAARGITGAAMDEYLPLFREHGLFHPAMDREIPRRRRAEGESALSLRSVSIVSGGRTLLENASADCPRGALTALLGASGSGKTTLLRAILRQTEHTGEILMGGQNVKKLSRRALFGQVGIVFQNPANQFITQNVLEEVLSSLRLWQKGLSGDALEKKARELLAAYGLESLSRYSPYMLSQGQQRRLAVLSVLCGGQAVLLLDEPTYGQDFRSADAIMRRLRQRAEADGLTVLFITHDETLARRHADKVYRLEDKALREVSL